MGRARGPAGEGRPPAGRPVARRAVPIRGATLCLFLFLTVAGAAAAQEPPQCLMCHGSPDTFQGVPDSARLVVDSTTFAHSVHGAAGLECTSCHQGITDLPHADSLPPVDCSTCHEVEVTQYARSIHGQAVARGDKLAPRCVDCHGTRDQGTHGIRAHTDSAARTFVMNVPSLCGSCHHEGSPVSRMRPIPQDSILENYSNSQHGAALLQMGLTVTAVCTSCHTAHNILPHTDPRSSINRNSVARTCMQCHTQIERVHRKVIQGRLWETAPHKLPACVDCHAPHVVRQVFYDTRTANQDCLACHGKPTLRGVAFGKTVSLYVDSAVFNSSVHGRQVIGCAQCHTEVTASLARPCSTIRSKVDCSPCHGPQVTQYQASRHGTLAAMADPDAPTCEDCHAKHAEQTDSVPSSPTFARNIPDLCARCHRKGEKAARRIAAKDAGLVQSYEESIHGKGLLKSGLTVTATCTSCHTAHMELPKSDPDSTVNPKNVPSTCGQCHHGIQEQFVKSIHSVTVTTTGAPLPVCSTCHTAHTIQRADAESFKLEIMDKCGKCHGEIAKTYFDTYHGKVSRLGYTKTAKCYDCHGAHDVLKVTDPNSHLSRANVVQTCRKCHADATRRFAGYLTHATHHDPRKYPFLFYTFWGMTALLVGTFVVGGVHTLLWLPRALEMRRNLKAEEAEAEENASRAKESGEGEQP